MKTHRTITTTAVVVALVLGSAGTALANEPVDGAEETPTTESVPSPETPDAEQMAPVDPVVAPGTPVENADDAVPGVMAEVPGGGAAVEAVAGGVTAALGPNALFAAPAAVYPDPDYTPHWHDGTKDGFACDYWFFTEPEDGGSGRDWSGWYGSPQLHILHHTLVDEDGTTHMVYDRDIANSWYHVWQSADGGEFVIPDPDGMHWENAAAQQTILMNGFRGGADMAARLADAEALFARAGVTVEYHWSVADFQWEIDNGYMTLEEAQAYVLEDNVWRADYTAYQATQFAIWYFSTGHDVMGLFFDVDEAGHVSLSEFAEKQFEQSDEYWGPWTGGGAGDRHATMLTAAWLIEQALTNTTVMPQPGFVSHGYIKNEDGSTDYGFTVSLVAGTGDVGVELRTADGSPVPAGVILVDAQGNPVTKVTPGERVYVRVPAGTDAASLPTFQLWGSATGTTQGTPNFYTGQDKSQSAWDPETHTHKYVGEQHWLIGLGSPDQVTTAWDWIAVDLALEPEAPTDPADPTDPTDPADPTAPVNPTPAEPTAPVDPADPTEPTAPIIAPVDPTDPTNLGDGATTIPVNHAATNDHLAQTGTDTLALTSLAALVTLAGTGLIITGRRRHTTATTTTTE